MKELKEMIVKHCKVLPNNVLKIDSFINHQIDVNFLMKIGEEFHRLFKDKEVTKILTVESSGIAIAVATAIYFDKCPVLYGKKVTSSNQDHSVYACRCYSYTRQREYHITVSKQYLKPEEKVLIIDDFFANGEALNALIDICHQAGCTIVGAGIVVEKSYQEGKERIKNLGVEVKSLAKIKSMDDDYIEFDSLS